MMSLNRQWDMGQAIGSKVDLVVCMLEKHSFIVGIGSVSCVYELCLLHVCHGTCVVLTQNAMCFVRSLVGNE